MSDRQNLETLIHDIDELTRWIRALARDIKLKPSEAHAHVIIRDVHEVVRWAHELRGRLRTVEDRAKLNIAEFSSHRGEFITNDRAYGEALTNARKAYHDDLAADRELAVCLTATQMVLNEHDLPSLWAAIPHLLHELKRLKSTLLRVVSDLKRAHPPS